MEASSFLHRPAPHLVSSMAVAPLGWRGRGAQGGQRMKKKQPSLDRHQPNMEDKRGSVTLWLWDFPECQGQASFCRVNPNPNPLLAGGLLDPN